jgi:addiction module HigA family antidote
MVLGIFHLLLFCERAADHIDKGKRMTEKKERATPRKRYLPGIANPSPGEILMKEFLEPVQLPRTALALAITVPSRRISAIVLGKRAITADTDLRLALLRHVGGIFHRPADGLRIDGA